MWSLTTIAIMTPIIKGEATPPEYAGAFTYLFVHRLFTYQNSSIWNILLQIQCFAHM